MLSKWKADVVGRFDACADVYDQHSDVQKAIAKSLADELPDFDVPSVLEIGCGTGALTQHLFDAYQGGQFHITDISPQMVEDARARIQTDDNVEWGVMDGEHPPMDRSYDLIISNMAFQWFEDIEAGIGRLRSLLNPSGILLYAIPAPTSFREWHTVLSELSLPSGTLNFDIPDSVFRMEERAVQYASTFTFLQNMKTLGAHTPRDGYEPLSAANLRKACQKCDEQFQGKMTWHILYGRVKAL